MATTKQIFNQFNKELKLKLIPKKGEPIECNSVINVQLEVFYKPILKLNVVQCN